jgi:hypothetical protein
MILYTVLPTVLTHSGGCVALFSLNYEIGSSKGSELHESVACGYILSTSSLLGLVPQEGTSGVSSVDSYSAHPLSDFGEEPVSHHPRYLG